MLAIIWFELQYRFRRPATYAYFAILFLLSLLFVSTKGITIGGATGQVFRNAPFIINQVTGVMCIFGTLIISAVMGVPVYRDFEHHFHEIMFATPIRKISYLGGRFIGSYLTTVFILSGIVLGIFAGQFMPWADEEMLGANIVGAYVQPFLNYILPNSLLLGAIFFAMGSYFRSQLAIYVQGVIVISLYLIVLQTIKDVDRNPLYSMLEPFGLSATSLVTKYWTTADKNTRIVPLEGLLLYNRLLWSGIGLLVVGTFGYLFRFSKSAPTFGRQKQAVASPSALVEGDAMTALSTISSLTIPFSTPNFGIVSQLNQWFFLVWFHVKNIVRSVPFLAITLCGMFILATNSVQIGSSMYGTHTLPLTYLVLDVVAASFGLFMIIIITFYVGELIWKEREVGLSGILDASPQKSLTVMFAKLVAMLVVVKLLLLVIMLMGISIQLWRGFTDIDLGLYVRYLFFYTFPTYALYVLLSFFIHSIVSNKFIGHVLLIAFYLLQFVLFALDINHNLVYYASSPSILYSEMNGFGHFVYPYALFNIYWLCLGLLMFVLAIVANQRGVEAGVSARWQSFLYNYGHSSARWLVPLLLLCFVLCGGFIFYNTNIENTYVSPKKQRELQRDYELKYRRYKDVAQPRITAVKVQADLYPDSHQFDLKGSYVIKNKHREKIDSVIVQTPSDAEIRSIRFVDGATLVVSEKALGLYIYRLSRPLEAQDSTTMTFDLHYGKRAFPNDGGNTNIVDNGSFINSSYCPSLGYSEGGELSDVDERKEMNLPKRANSLPSPTDTAALQNTYLSSDSDWITFEATVSTVPDQIAIAPGYLQREWTDQGRRYFHYKMDSKILNFYSFLSARYAVKRDKWRDVAIEIYYHPSHTYNIDRMILGVKKSLEYCSTQFSPYQHRQLRIIEFPRYATFAQSFPNTIPFSESIGFVLDADKAEDLDFAFYVTAHEVAHQWWAHQVIGAAVRGSTVMSESMAQYSALMVMEHQYGKAALGKYLKYELDTYLRGRSSERKAEQPLALNENQAYIHYQKGSLAMYALKDYIGEERLNKALSEYVRQTAFQEPPYTTSVEFLSYLRRATPDSLQYLIKDLFESITLFGNESSKATYKVEANGTYSVELDLLSDKFVADSLGNETAVPLNDWIDIGVYGTGSTGKDSLIYLKKHLIKDKKSSIRVEVSELPSKAGIDPLHILVDRDSDDNVVSVVKRN